MPHSRLHGFRLFLIACFILSALAVRPDFPAKAQIEEQGTSAGGASVAFLANNSAVGIAAGGSHTCAMTVGGIICWGDNGYGQLGGYPELGGTGPVSIYGLPGGLNAVSISAGGQHNCAVTSTGGVMCWGYNGSGQLGNGKTTNYPNSIPVQVSGLTSGIKVVAAGGNHTCALTEAGGVKCWGANGQGQLGDGTKVTRTTPVDVSGLTSGVIALDAGNYDTCAVTSSGGVKCWGGLLSPVVLPTDESGLTSGVVAVAVGDFHNCALMSTGGVKCWGRNSEGELGNGTNVSTGTATDVVGLTSGVKMITTGNSQTCAFTESGSVKCWGENSYGQVGDGATADRFTPLTVAGLPGKAVAVSAGDLHTCAVFVDGTGKCWGSNLEGELGVGTLKERVVPADVVGLTGPAAAVAVGGYHTCRLSPGGAASCWGGNSFGAVGDGTTVNRSSPAGVSGLSSGVQSISAGIVYTCAVTTTGGLKCWGYNLHGQLGDGTTQTRITPTDVSGLTGGVAAVSVRDYHTCAVTTGGGLKCWGLNNTNGVLGDGTTMDRYTPVDVVGLTSDVKAVALGEAHACALTTRGGVKCWGTNGSGRLGDGTTNPSLTPVDVVGLSSGVKAISVGFYHSCALTDAGGVKCWGYNYDGQLGNGSSTSSTVPVNVTGLTSGVTAIASGIWHTCALTSAGAVKCWGANDKGELGNGTENDFYSPVSVTGLSAGVSAISAGKESTCALMANGGIKCWGDDYDGQAGTGRIFNTTTPVDMVGLAPFQLFSISGTISDSSGPIAGVTVFLSDPGGVVDQQITGEDGAFTFSGLMAGAYTLLPSYPNRLFTPASRAVALSGQDATGQDFTGAYRPASISGAVSTGNGPLAGVTVSLQETGVERDQKVTGADGTYAFLDLPEGTYTLVPTNQDYIFSPISREVSLAGADMTGTDFTGEYQLFPISGVVSMACGTLSEVTITISDSSGAVDQVVTGEDGAFRSSDLSVGTYTVMPSRPGYLFTPASQEVILVDQEVRGVDFSGAYAPASISGTVSTSKGPLSGAVVALKDTSGTIAEQITGNDGSFTFIDLDAGAYRLVVSMANYTFTPAEREITLSGAPITSADFLGTYAGKFFLPTVFK